MSLQELHDRGGLPLSEVSGILFSSCFLLAWWWYVRDVGRYKLIEIFSNKSDVCMYTTLLGISFIHIFSLSPVNSDNYFRFYWEKLNSFGTVHDFYIPVTFIFVWCNHSQHCCHVLFCSTKIKHNVNKAYICMDNKYTIIAHYQLLKLNEA